MRRTILVGAVVALLGVAGSLHAQGSYVADDNLGYTGTIVRYNTLSDYLTQSNGTTAIVPARDLSLYFVDDNPAFGGYPSYPASAAIMMSNWFANGGNTPSNQNYGFLQNYDDDAGSVTSLSMGWLDPTMTSFQLTATGGPTLYGCDPDPFATVDCSRLWDGVDPGASANGGIFESWSISLDVYGLAPAVYDAGTGVYESQSDPTSVTGSINGVFYDPTEGDYEVVSLDIDDVSWAVDNGYGDQSYFGSNATITPEPGALVLVVTGLVGIAPLAARRRRRRTI